MSVVKWGYRARKLNKHYDTADRIFWGHYVRISYDTDMFLNYRAYWNAFEMNDIGYEEGYAADIEGAMKDVESKLGLGWKWYDSISDLPRKAKFILS